jgi:hypothetical protein
MLESPRPLHFGGMIRSSDPTECRSFWLQDQAGQVQKIHAWTDQPSPQWCSRHVDGLTGRCGIIIDGRMAIGTEKNGWRVRVAVTLLLAVAITLQGALFATVSAMRAVEAVGIVHDHSTCNPHADAPRALDDDASNQHHLVQIGHDHDAAGDGTSSPSRPGTMDDLQCCVQVGSAVLPQLMWPGRASAPASDRAGPLASARLDDFIPDGPSKPPRTSHQF